MNLSTWVPGDGEFGSASRLVERLQGDTGFVSSQDDPFEFERSLFEVRAVAGGNDHVTLILRRPTDSRDGTGAVKQMFTVADVKVIASYDGPVLLFDSNSDNGGDLVDRHVVRRLDHFQRVKLRAFEDGGMRDAGQIVIRAMDRFIARAEDLL